MKGKLIEKTSLRRELKFCLWMTIIILPLFRLDHCQGLLLQQLVHKTHETSDTILRDSSTGVFDSSIDRRRILRSAMAVGLISSRPKISFASTTPNESTIVHPFTYSDNWKGTNLKIMSLEESISPTAYSRDETSGILYWAMGKWPDPALRVPATPIQRFNPDQLQLAANILRNTARREGAVGLAAQQCGVDARMVFLSGSNKDMVLVNPRIVNRSPESSMKVWTEECLVLPPTFRATVLRDEWIDVQYDFAYEYTSNNLQNQTPKLVSSVPLSDDNLDVSSTTPIVKRFYKEQSRCLQHELDHDRGILITDHVGLDELENDVMRTIEQKDHDRRQLLAYSRE